MRQEARQKGEFAFLCPKPECDSRRTNKAKLWVNPAQDRFHCWVCGFGNRNSLAQLMVPGSPEHREYLAERAPNGTKCVVVQVEKPPCSSLPQGFTPLDLSRPTSAAPYLTYMRGRGLSEGTLGLYRAGYVDEGPLAGRIVVPSFDLLGSINFWSARTMYPNVRPSYVLPDATKDIISNEHLVDWSQPIYLVEGIFDEIAIGPQAIAMYGKFMQPKLALRLVEKRPPMVHVCLDSDAGREARALLTRIVGYDIPCSLIELPSKDPSAAGAEAVRLATELAPTVTGSAGLVSRRFV